ncbi:heavy metal translocating P-type ATPase [Acetivibrio saccincola]|uniref:Cadmium-translocating P-type ATPase n=1 Tax=Acetivibrio saccincola TaxID=1677857 RepID=A0A2S8RAF5_9FIRM|nr:heavy metal translocating P-type ATPase [Acetivibrio saccincola]PQQ66766.1 cadmium-translocating P-type ATPase [Acetivibrio saccincola]
MKRKIDLDKANIIKLAVGGVLFFTALLADLPYWANIGIYLASYIIIGGDVLLKSIKNISRGEIFDENFLMAIATIGAFAIKEYPEAVAVMLFYQVGELLQDIAVSRSRNSIAELMDIRPDYANLVIGNKTKKVSPKEVKTEDIILIRPGEKVPLDGEVVEGKSVVDTTALTGESVPREVKEGDEILSGFINKNGVLKVKVTKEFEESTVSKILNLVENAAGKKAAAEKFITKFAKYYTPAVVGIAAALAIVPPLLIHEATFSQWLYRSLVFLVISCPCALVISIPLGFFGGIGSASRNGVLVKGGNYLEALNSLHTVVFDKTGTLTKGIFEVAGVYPQNGFSKDELLKYAAMSEEYSTHPIADSIKKAYGKKVDRSNIDSYEEISGMGIKAKIKGIDIYAGNAKLMNLLNVKYKEEDYIGTTVHIAVGGKYAGVLVISDELKEDAKETVEDLRKMGVKKISMLTGDSENVAKKVGSILNLDKVYAELLPHEKVEKLELLEKEKPPKGKLLFVGDGINDAPVLARADIGAAMGGLGSDAAIEAADIVLMTDEPSKLITAIKIAQKTRRIVWQNIIFAFGIKFAVLLLGAGGIASMWEAVFADVGVALLAVVNAMRIIRPQN